MELKNRENGRQIEITLVYVIIENPMCFFKKKKKEKFKCYKSAVEHTITN